VQRNANGGRKIILVQSGHIKNRKELMEKVRSLVRVEAD
jgi:hypothetical protein